MGQLLSPQRRVLIGNDRSAAGRELGRTAKRTLAEGSFREFPSGATVSGVSGATTVPTPFVGVGRRTGIGKMPLTNKPGMSGRLLD